MTLNVQVVGRCSLCGDRVTVPTIFHSVVPPVPTCEKCGAVMKDNLPNLPIIPMVPPKPSKSVTIASNKNCKYEVT